MLALIGLRCSGKSTVGRLLAAHLGASFADLDEELVALARERGRAESQAGALLTAVGEAAFRELESAALGRVLSRAGPQVLATGGGTLEEAANRAALGRTALCVLLDARDEVLAARLERTRVERPALAAEDGHAEVRRLRARRATQLAELAAVCLDGSDRPPAQVARSLAERVRLLPALGFELSS